MTARFEEAFYEELRQYAEEKGIPEPTALRELTQEGLRQWKLTKALSLYRDEQITLWKAARMAEVPLSKMMELAAAQKIPIHYRKEDLTRDFAAVFGDQE